ncbi:MAG: DUF2782 domain-containing protein [Gammaproteobacteria bacterium]|nr:DUF2782 domain-containing protein [Gammaproteobacteria bacterium]
MKKKFSCFFKGFLIISSILLPIYVQAEEDQSLEPEVTIIDGEQHTIEEYRLNGKLYMIKIVPAVGPHYFLVDSDGDGEFETQRYTDDSEMMVPRWTLFEW